MLCQKTVRGEAHDVEQNDGEIARHAESGAYPAGSGRTGAKGRGGEIRPRPRERHGRGALCAAQGNEAQAREKPQARENRRPAIL